MSRHSIQAVLDAAERLGLGWDEVAEQSEAEVYAALFPGRGVRESVFAQPDWPRVHTRAGPGWGDVEAAAPGVCRRVVPGRAGGDEL